MYCHQRLHYYLMSSEHIMTRPEYALYFAVEKTEKMFMAECRAHNVEFSSGTTATIAYIEEDMCYIANVGDSRMVLSRGGVAHALTIDHKPEHPFERARIQQMGGFVGRSKAEAFNTGDDFACCCMCCCCLPNWLRRLACCGCGDQAPHRVWPGGLSVSRTIGDKSIKDRGVVSADPDVFTYKLQPGDDFLVLACDGVWDVLSNQDAVDTIMRFREMNQYDAAAASEALARRAFKRGSTDNISSVVVYVNLVDVT
jgi:serine/threonine protein phosphatase PrpC